MFSFSAYASRITPPRFKPSSCSLIGIGGVLVAALGSCTARRDILSSGSPGSGYQPMSGKLLPLLARLNSLWAIASF